MIEVGRIAAAHGVRGALRLSIGAGTEEVFVPGRTVFLGSPKENGQAFAVKSVSRHNKGLLVYLEGIATRDEAEELAGRLVRVERDCLPGLEKGEYYWFEIIGLEVFTKDGGRLGIVTEIIETGANDVYVVSDEETKAEILVPALEWVIAAVDLDNKRMVVDLPEGL